MKRFAWLWVSTFFANVWRKNDYYWPGERCSVQNAAHVASVIAYTCWSIRAERKDSPKPYAPKGAKP